MTFQSKLDVWQPESLRTDNCPRKGSAAEIVHLAATGALAPLPEMPPLVTSESGCVRGPWTPAWRQMLSRKIDWAAVRLATVSRTIERWAVFNNAAARLAAIELLPSVPCEQEVETSASA